MRSNRFVAGRSDRGFMDVVIDDKERAHELIYEAQRWRRVSALTVDRLLREVSLTMAENCEAALANLLETTRVEAKAHHGRDQDPR